MAEQNLGKVYDLEQRTWKFAKDVRVFLKRVSNGEGNLEDKKQLIRSSGSIGANYIEANESLGKKDFLMHIRISRKEAKESRYWLELMDVQNNNLLGVRNKLIQESTELMKIFGSIIRKF